MNILIIKNPLSSQPHGGGERHTMQVARHWRSRGHKIYFATTCRYLSELARRAGFEIDNISWAGQEAVSELALAKFIFTWPLIARRWRKYLARQRAERQINCLYIYSWNEKFLLGPIARSLKMKIIFVEHRLLEKFIRLNPFRRWYAKNAELGVVVAVSEAVKRSALAVGVPESTIKVIYNGIDLAEFRTFKKTPHRGLRLGTVSRLSRDKGLDNLISAAAKLKDEFAELEVEIVGAGPDEKKLRELVDRLGAGQTVKFLGGLSHDQVVKFLATLDVFTLTPTHGESFGLALAEAGAASLPCVVTDVGGVAEVIKHNETGLVVPPDSPVALIGALKELLTNQAEREHFGRAARVRVERMFTQEKMLGKFDQIISNL